MVEAGVGDVAREAARRLRVVGRANRADPRSGSAYNHPVTTTSVAHLPHRSVRYLEAGRGRAAILLHAFPLSADQWLPQLARVPRGWRFIAPDLGGFRGAGPLSEVGVPGAPSIDAYAADVLALMAHLDVPAAVVAGVSMGGYVAFGLLRQAPSKVVGLVLANTRAAADTAEARAGREKMLDLLRREGPGGIAHDMVPKLLGKTTQAEQPDLADAVRALIIANTPEAIANGIVALRDRPDSTPLLPAIACPTLVVTGDEDALIPMAEAESMHRAIPGARLQVLPKVGHLSNLEGAGVAALTVGIEQLTAVSGS